MCILGVLVWTGNMISEVLPISVDGMCFSVKILALGFGPGLSWKKKKKSLEFGTDWFEPGWNDFS